MAKSIDGDVENESTATSQTFEIISLDPANPHDGFSDSLDIEDFQASTLRTEGYYSPI